MSVDGRRFPIMDGPSIPWAMIEPHEKQAIANHDQTLTTLAKRGGLECHEALAVLDGVGYRVALERWGDGAAAELQRRIDAHEPRRRR